MAQHKPRTALSGTLGSCPHLTTPARHGSCPPIPGVSAFPLYSQLGTRSSATPFPGSSHETPEHPSHRPERRGTAHQGSDGAGQPGQGRSRDAGEASPPARGTVTQGSRLPAPGSRLLHKRQQRVQPQGERRSEQEPRPGATPGMGSLARTRSHRPVPRVWSRASCSHTTPCSRTGPIPSPSLWID